VGYGFVQHGVAKLLNGPDHFAANLAALGVPAPGIMSWITIISELGCGLAVLVGALIIPVSIPMVIILIVAMLRVHLPFGFSSVKLQAVTPDGIKFGPPGYEVILLYLVCLLTLNILGAGPLSVDSWLKTKLTQPK
jgi:putative oxidoreductase